MGAACPVNGIVIWGAKFSLLDTRVLIATGFLAGILFLGAAIIALVSNWRKRQENATFSMHDQLASFRALYEQGLMSAEEFERVKGQLLGRLKKTPAPGGKMPAPTKPATTANTGANTGAAPGPQPPLPPEPPPPGPPPGPTDSPTNV